MVVNGGSDRRRYACAHASQRQTCENKVTVRVSDAQDAILGALRRRFTNPVAIAYVRKRVVGRLTEMLQAIDAEIAERRARLQRVEVIYIARGDLSWLGLVLSPSNAKPSADNSGRVSVPPIDGLSCGGWI